MVYRPLADPEAWVHLLILTRSPSRSLLVEAFMGVVEELLRSRPALAPTTLPA
ncbi:hypothetical protein PFLmoz3_02009 [Pseudomonas fluorescens]|uniref:Uncharacterized protein n=1 Tax=Pseudomonas fluorescens TaxID=294 RepID=A0A109LKG1_PSEFL|nr:hypothetical protein PFLmoz3_02009 [Pseudomonas fluorescens]